MTTGIIVFAHGSRIEPANEAVRKAAAELARTGEHARGVHRLVIVPYFLTPGMHLERDLPALVDRISKKHRNIQVLVTESLDGHPGLVQILADRVRTVEPPTLK